MRGRRPAELRALTGLEKRQVDAAVVALQRLLVLTNSHVVEQRNGWGAIAVDLLARRWPQRQLPAADEAERALAATVLASCGELSAADLGGALGWRLKRSRETLEALVERGEATRRATIGARSASGRRMALALGMPAEQESRSTVESLTAHLDRARGEARVHSTKRPRPSGEIRGFP